LDRLRSWDNHRFSGRKTRCRNGRIAGSEEEPLGLRLLSMFGFVAHFGDVVTGVFKRRTLRQQLVAGTARIPGALVVALILGVTATGTLVTAVRSNAEKAPTTYTVEQLTTMRDRGGKDYATITGSIYGFYMQETSGSSTFTYFLLADTVGSGEPRYIVVRSSLTDLQMDQLASPDGTWTLTGMLTDDGSAVGNTLSTLGTDAPDLVDSSLVLHQGETPLPAGPFYAAAGVSGLFGILLLVSWLITLAVGYVVFKPAAARLSPISGPGEGFLPVRVTGLVSGYRNGRRTRELRAELRVPPTDPAEGPPPLELVWTASKTLKAGVRLVPGIESVAMGTAYPVLGPRPAIEVRFGGCDVILSFDGDTARDAAFDQIVAMAELVASPDGAGAAAPPAPVETAAA
jgi:hypothetical protein